MSGFDSFFRVTGSEVSLSNPNLAGGLITRPLLVVRKGRCTRCGRVVVGGLEVPTGLVVFREAASCLSFNF